MNFEKDVKSSKLRERKLPQETILNLFYVSLYILH